MCGICGVYGFGDGSGVTENVLRDMIASIRHRGPDDLGFHREDGVGLGSCRLSIIDLPGGRQPMTNESGEVIAVFNGEIYNYRELTAELRARGHRFSTASDTEVIVHLYEDLGERCVDELRGMFAFAVWDRRRGRLFLARDRIGIKPLYYAQLGERLVFGSEIKAILKHPLVRPALDLEALGSYLSLRYVPAPQTMFAGIRALPPGHLLTCDADGVAVRPYWDLSFAGAVDGRSEESYAEELEAILRDAVRVHLMSDVPFGAFLSGGIDSSTIVALMTDFLEEPVKTFSVGYRGAGEAFSELPFARLVAERYETDHHEVMVEPAHFTQLAEKVVWHLDQPIADDAVLMNYLVAELASQHVKMVLTGEGGDELFAGYARYAGEKLSPFFRWLPHSGRSLLMSAAGRLPGLRRPKLALNALLQPNEIDRLASWFPLFNRDMKAALLTDELLRDELHADSGRVAFAEQLARTDASDPLSRMLYVDTKLWLPDVLLARGDKTAMAASVEARVPLLDHKLVEFACSLPPNLKLRGLARKYLLKKVSSRWLPPEIIDRKKKGFPTPLSLWLRGEARPFMRDLLSTATVNRRGLFDPRFVERLVGEHEVGRADHGLLLWGLLSVEMWHGLFIDRSPVPPFASPVLSTTEDG